MGDGVGWNVGERFNTNFTFGGIIFAGAIVFGVWIGRLKLLKIGLKIGEGMARPSSLASIASFVAGNNFLLREGQEISML